MTTIKQPNNNSKIPISNSCSRKKKHITTNSGPIGIDFVRFSRRFRDYSIQTSKANKQANVRVPKRYSGFFTPPAPPGRDSEGCARCGPIGPVQQKKVSGAGASVIGVAPPRWFRPPFYRISATPTIPFLPCAPQLEPLLFFRDKPQMQELMQHNTMMLMISAKI